MSLPIIGLALFFIILGFASVFAAYLAERRYRKVIRDRIAQIWTQAKPTDLVLAKQFAGYPASPENQLLYRIFGAGMERRWGVHIAPAPLVVVALSSCALIWVIAGLLLHLSITIVAPAVIAGGWLLPRTLMRSQQAGADKQFMELFPNAIDMIVRMIRAGLPVTAALTAVGDEAPEPVGPVFKALADKMAIGVPFEQALHAHAIKIALADFRFFAVAIALQKSTGGNLAVTLDTLGAIIRQRRSVRLKAHAATGEERMSAIVLGGLPFFVTGGLLIMNPKYLAPLITDPRGHLIVGAALLSLATGWLIMRRMLSSIMTT